MAGSTNSVTVITNKSLLIVYEFRQIKKPYSQTDVYASVSQSVWGVDRTVVIALSPSSLDVEILLKTHRRKFELEDPFSEHTIDLGFRRVFNKLLKCCKKLYILNKWQTIIENFSQFENYFNRFSL